MNKSSWIALSSLLWVGQLSAQANPAPSTPGGKPAEHHAPGAPGTTPAQKPSTPTTSTSTPAKPAATTPSTAAAPAGTTGAATSGIGNPNDKSAEWTLDPAHSHIGFTARHLGFSKANGQFKKFSGVVHADPKTGKISALEANAETASIDTGIEKRDTHLRSDDFLNSDKYPQLKLTTKSLKWNGNKFTANVELTIRDVTKTVPFKGELLGVHKVNFGQGEQVRAGYEATATINRKDFGLKWNMVTEGLAVVADPIELQLTAEIFLPSGAPTAAATPAGKPATPTTTTAAHAAEKAPLNPSATTPTPKPAAPPTTATAAKPATPPAHQH